MLEGAEGAHLFELSQVFQNVFSYNRLHAAFISTPRLCCALGVGALSLEANQGRAAIKSKKYSCK